jgi:hypothetical protein
VMHVDTGLNFPEVLAFRDRRVAELGVELVIASVPDAIAAGTGKQEPNGSRNRIQTPVLLDAVEQHGFTALFGGARRDEDKARAKERVFSFRDEFGQWDPKNQRPELWDLYNGRIHLGESIRVFPLSNWTELDIWSYIAQEQIAIPDLYLAAERDVVDRGGIRDRGDPADRARRHPGRRQGQRRRHGGPQEGGLLLMAPAAADHEPAHQGDQQGHPEQPAHDLRDAGAQRGAERGVQPAADQHGEAVADQVTHQDDQQSGDQRGEEHPVSVRPLHVARQPDRRPDPQEVAA